MLTRERIKKGTVVYYAQCLPTIGTFEILELKIRTIQDNWFVGTEKREKHTYMFYEKDLNKTIFLDRDEALDVVKEAEKNCKCKYSDETYYEEF